MARVTPNLLGSLSGRLGPYVLREMNGKSFISDRPKKYKTKKTKNPNAATSIFGRLSKFAAYINAFPEINSIWKISAPKGKRGYNYIISTNGKSLKEGLFNIDNFIAPGGLPVNLSKFDCDFKNLSISFSIDNSSSISSNIQKIKSFALFCFQNPKEKNLDLIRLTNAVPQNLDFNPDKQYNLSQSLPAEIKDISQMYNSCTIYFTSVLLNSKGNIINWLFSEAKTLTSIN